MKTGDIIYFNTEDASGDIVEHKGVIMGIEDEYLTVDTGYCHNFRIHKEQVR